MRFRKTEVDGCFFVDMEPHVDFRGFFARAYCPKEFADAGIEFTSSQVNIARSPAAFTLRGMHYAEGELAESKFVRCIRGRAYDAVVDIRPDSPTFRRWTACELDSRRGNAVFVPKGCAHGYLTLEPDCDILYQMSKLYVPGQDKALRWNDPAFGIAWPSEPLVMSDGDRDAPFFAG